MPWWDATYASRLQVTIPASPSGYAAGAVATLAFETHVPIDAGQMRADRHDLRLVRDTGSCVEIDRVLTNTATILFRVQAAIAPNTACTDYWLYYGSPNASAPPENPRNVYPVFINPADD